VGGSRLPGKRAGAGGLLPALPLLLFLLLAVAWPLSHLAAAAVTGAGRSALAEVLSAGRYRTSLVNSLVLSAAAAAAAVALSILPAWVLARERFAGRRLLRAAIALPLTFSGVLVGFLMVVMLGRVGAVPVLLQRLTGRELLAGSAYTSAGLFCAYLYFEVPRAVMTLEAAFRRFPGELDAAARTLGASARERLLRIGLPLLAPALRSTFALTFSASMGSFGVALILARRFTVAPLEVYNQLIGFLDDATAGALCLLLALATLAADRLLGGGTRPGAAGRGEALSSLRARPSRLARRAGIAVAAAAAALLCAPIAITVAGAFSSSPWYGQRSEGAPVAGTAPLFRYVLGLWGPNLLRSAELALAVVPLALLLGAPAAYAFRRRPFPGSRLLEAAAVAPLAIPGIALAVALIETAGGAPRIALLAAGHLVYTVPLVVKTVGNALESHDPRLEGAARSLGAGRLAVLARLVVPLLAPALVLSALLVFAVSWGEFNASFLLATPLVQTFPAALYLTYTTNSFPVAAAATLIFLLPVAPAVAAIQALGGEELRRGPQA
jgi:putative spermidine/putrescine transport system permease protein